VYDFPEGGRTARGLPIINLLPIEQEESITAVIPVSEFRKDKFLIMLTRRGWIKKIDLSNFASIRRNGIIAIGLGEDDTLGWVNLAEEIDEIIIGTALGMAIKFQASALRPLGRSARGVTAIKLRSDDSIVGCDIVPKNRAADLLVVTTDGFGKRSSISEFRPQNRGGIGLIATKFKKQTSRVTTITIVSDNDEIMIVTANGVVTRQKAAHISRQGRPATGVRIQTLGENDAVVAVNKIVLPDEDDEIVINKPLSPDLGLF
jgi:DNA gyrase subunit A